jgi:hypothetical protein
MAYLRALGRAVFGCTSKDWSRKSRAAPGPPRAMASLPLRAPRRAAAPASPCARTARRTAHRAPRVPRRASAASHAADDAARSATRPRAATLHASSSVELLEGYDATMTAICAEVDACAAGDVSTLRSYVIEGGSSSRRLLASLRAAAARGVTLHLGCDRSALSVLTRAWERTDTLAHELDALAREFPDTVRDGASPAAGTTRCAAVPDHSKWLMVHRPGAPEACAAVFGGINIGGARSSLRGRVSRKRYRRFVRNRLFSAVWLTVYPWRRFARSRRPLPVLARLRGAPARQQRHRRAGGSARGRGRRAARAGPRRGRRQ